MPRNGTVIVDPTRGVLIYTSFANMVGGTDSLTYQICMKSNLATEAATRHCTQARVNIEIGYAIQARDNFAFIDRSKKIDVNVAFSFDPSMPITFSVVREQDSGPFHGRIIDVNSKTGQVTYLPKDNFIGKDHFTYEV